MTTMATHDGGDTVPISQQLYWIRSRGDPDWNATSLEQGNAASPLLRYNRAQSLRIPRGRPYRPRRVYGRLLKFGA